MGCGGGGACGQSERRDHAGRDRLRRGYARENLSCGPAAATNSYRVADLSSREFVVRAASGHEKLLGRRAGLARVVVRAGSGHEKSLGSDLRSREFVERVGSGHEKSLGRDLRSREFVVRAGSGHEEASRARVSTEDLVAGRESAQEKLSPPPSRARQVLPGQVPFGGPGERCQAAAALPVASPTLPPVPGSTEPPTAVARTGRRVRGAKGARLGRHAEVARGEPRHPSAGTQPAPGCAAACTLALTMSDEDALRARAAARAAWPGHKGTLADAHDAVDLSATTSVDERLAMMWPLSRDAWAASGRPFPTYSRAEMPGVVLRAKPR